MPRSDVPFPLSAISQLTVQSDLSPTLESPFTPKTPANSVRSYRPSVESPSELLIEQHVHADCRGFEIVVESFERHTQIAVQVVRQLLEEYRLENSALSRVLKQKDEQIELLVATVKHMAQFVNCPSCMGLCEKPVVLACGHFGCKDCVRLGDDFDTRDECMTCGRLIDEPLLDMTK